MGTSRFCFATLAGLVVLTGCARGSRYVDPAPQRSVRPLAASDAVCSGLQVAMDSIVTGHAGSHVVLDSRTTLYNGSTRIASYLSKLVATPSLLADTWRSFQEQNVRTQPACTQGTRPGSIVQGAAPVAGLHGPQWARQFNGLHPGAIAWVDMSGPGLSDDGRQLFLMLDVVFANGEYFIYHAALDRTNPSRVWSVKVLFAESMNQ